MIGSPAERAPDTHGKRRCGYVEPLFTLTWRQSDKDGRVTMAAATAISHEAAGPWSTTPLVQGNDVPWAMNDDPGFFTGLSAMEVCTVQPCPGTGVASYPDVPFLAAWGDHRKGGASEIWTKAVRP